MSGAMNGSTSGAGWLAPASRVWRSVPVANLLFHASNFLIRRAGEDRKLELSQQERTEASGIREIPFKTVFPAPFKLVLNPLGMYPFFFAAAFLLWISDRPDTAGQ